MARIHLDITEITACISACLTQETALELRIKSARKKNELVEAADASADYADLLFAKRKLEAALKNSTNTKPGG